jgi:hypothetical protein
MGVGTLGGQRVIYLGTTYWGNVNIPSISPNEVVNWTPQERLKMRIALERALMNLNGPRKPNIFDYYK